MAKENKLDKIVSLAKRRGFVFPGSEIYGGLSGFYDYGPLGVELSFNIKQEWWSDVVKKRDDIVGVRTAVVMNPRVWEASGHLEGFTDVLVECKKCHQRFKADDFSGKCENCGEKEFTEPRRFNTMFKTFVGPAEDSASITYLRPETTPGIIINFKNVLDTMRLKIPFGIAQIGKSFRNEINPKDFIFRVREFDHMEIEYFVRPEDADKYFDEWVDLRLKWYQRLGLKNIHKREQSKDERAHYSAATVDIEYEFPFGWKEIEGIANRTDFDLKTHSEHSGVDLSYTDDSGEKFIPYVIEPSAGPERLMLAFLCEAYDDSDKERLVLKLHPKLAPYKAAVFPLLANKPELVEKARSVYDELKKHFTVDWDDRGNVGKRYYSQDEIGTPFCVTVDFKTLEDDTVTVRDRDTTKQERIKTAELENYFKVKLK